MYHLRDSTHGETLRVPLVAVGASPSINADLPETISDAASKTW